jgi:hypothetical protein
MAVLLLLLSGFMPGTREEGAAASLPLAFVPLDTLLLFGDTI